MAAPVQAVPERRCSLEEILPPSSTPIQHGRTHSLSSSYASSYDEEGEYGSARYSFSSQVSTPSTPQSFSNHNSSSRRLSGPHQLLTRQVVEQLSKESPMMAVPSVEVGEDGWLSRTVHSAPVRTARYLLRKYSRRETALCCIEKQHPLRHRLRRLVKSKYVCANLHTCTCHIVVTSVHGIACPRAQPRATHALKCIGMHCKYACWVKQTYILHGPLKYKCVCACILYHNNSYWCMCVCVCVCVVCVVCVCRWFNAGVGLIVLLHLVVLAVVYKPYNNEDFNRDWNLPVVCVRVCVCVCVHIRTYIYMYGLSSPHRSMLQYHLYSYTW